jgi:hypothetical protein
VEFTPAHEARLEEISAVPLGFPHEFLTRPMVQQVVGGGARVSTRQRT